MKVNMCFKQFPELCVGPIAYIKDMYDSVLMLDLNN